ncbi:MAG: hypothetical protein H0W33_02525 [Gammaproteobacteria bacterium]|nr:hypothetical protein [Gammaproteobacteria bacterium]
MIDGTVQKCRSSPPSLEVAVLDDVPPAPDWLPNAHAKKEWTRIAKILVENKILTDAALTALGHLCALHGKIAQLWAAGEAPTGHLYAQYRALCNDFGLTPKHDKVHPVATKEKGNPFEKFTGKGPPAANKGKRKK